MRTSFKAYTTSRLHKQADNKDTRLDCRVTIPTQYGQQLYPSMSLYSTPPPYKLVLQHPMTYPVGDARVSFPVTNTIPSNPVTGNSGNSPISSVEIFLLALFFTTTRLLLD